MKRLIVILITLALIACQSNTNPPVINRSPQKSKPAPSVDTKISATKNNDIRPDTYYVKKGDTLYSIGLEYGYYYKDIAAANNIKSPYQIQIGQKLDFTHLNNQASAIAKEDSVIITPIEADTEPMSIVPTLNEPKAIIEPYSQAAFNRKAPPPTKTTAATIPLPTKEDLPDKTPNATKTTHIDNINWRRPTQGKVTADFNSANKGIDIAGKLGQSIHAAANGKVIYSGSDLRGYGKLVIIKHNTTYLSVYAHNNLILVKEGQQVKAGQKIAEMGKTDANSVKLHYEIRKQGKSINPMPYLPKD